MSLPGSELPNDADVNQCIACAPANPRGLHMRFFADKDVVRSELTLDDTFCGDPGRVHEGVLFTAMDDALYWAAWALEGWLGQYGPFVEAAFPAKIATHRPFVVEARAVGRARGHRQYQGTCVQDGEVRARLVREVGPYSEAEYRRILDEPALPASVREDFEASRAVVRGRRATSR